MHSLFQFAFLVIALLGSIQAIPRVQESRPNKHQAFINATKKLERSRRVDKQTCTPRAFL